MFGPDPPLRIGLPFDELVTLKDVGEALELTIASFTLTYNATVISIVGGDDNVTINPFWGTFKVTVLEALDPALLDTVTISVASPSSNPSGDVPVATIKFTIMIQGICPPEFNAYSSCLDFSNVLFYHDSTEIPSGTSLNGTVTIFPLRNGHFFPDISVENIALSKTICGQGYILRINVTLLNLRDKAEVSNVTVLVNNTIIGEFTNITLPGYPSMTRIALTLNTANSAKGRYSINATVSPIPEERFKWNNTLIVGPIFVSIPGDVNADRKVDLKDVYAVSKAYGSMLVGREHGKYWHDPPCSCCPHSPNYDVNDDGKIDLKDYYAISSNFGKGW